MRDEAVDDQTRHKSTQQSFQPGQFGQGSTEEDEGHDEDVLRHTVIEAAQETAGCPGEAKDDGETVEDALEEEEEPVEPIGIGVLAAHHEGQRKQGEEGGEGCGYDRHDDTRMAPHTIASHDGVAHQGVGGKETGHHE